MFVYNRCTTDVRVLREAATLRGAGHEVTIFAVLDATTQPAEVRPDGTRIRRIDRRPLHYRLVWFVRGRRRAARLGSRRAARRLVMLPLGLMPSKRAAMLREAADRRGIGASDAVKLALVPLAPPVLAGSWLSSRARRLLYRAHKPLMYLDFWGRAYRSARLESFDVVHAHDLNTLPAAALVARATGAQLIYDAHELFPETSTLSAREQRVWRWLEPRLIRRADRVVTVCDSIAEELARRYGIAKPGVLLNCPPARAAVQPAASPLRAAAGLDGESELRLILYQGGFAPNRGLAELILAAHEIDGAMLVLMGWGAIEAELARLVETEGLSSRVRMLPPVPTDELHVWTAGADIGVIPYQPVGLNNFYSTPNKLFEYLAAGVPIAATRLPEIARIVDGHRIGATFDAVEPVAIAAAINRLLADEQSRVQMRERALATAPQYTWERQANELLALYESLGPQRNLPVRG